MIKDRDVCLIGATFELQADIQPDSALCGGKLVALTAAVHHAAFHAGSPRHAEEKPAVIVFCEGEIDQSFAFPFEIEEVTAAVVAHGPDLCFGHDRLARRVEEVVNGGPLDLATLRNDQLTRDASPVTVVGIVKVVAAIDAGESPEESGLVLVMPRAEFGEHVRTVRGDDRMKVGTEIRPGVLGEDRLRDIVTIDRDRVRGRVLAQREVGSAGRMEGGGENGEECYCGFVHCGSCLFCA